VRITPRLIAAKKTQLLELENKPVECYDGGVVTALRRELSMLMGKEEVFWCQRSRVSWLKGGDRNTSFFHESASQRKKANTIVGLRDLNDNWQTDMGTMESIAVAYFNHLFTSSIPSTVGEVVQYVDPVVTTDTNADLMRPFTYDEVKRALFQMHPSKAPGPDGMTVLFFQKCWHVVGTDVSHVVLDFLNSGRMLGCINFTHIVLIPKVKNPQCMSQFRPISLCNVIYKIISKVLVNRMKVNLPRVISDSQSTFVPGRMITDNVIISFDMLHYLKNHRVGNNVQIAAKLDMSKAYDRVEWDYLKAILLKLGFHERWVHLVMTCVTSTTYSIMINGEPKGFVKPTQGLRQGDPLSLYLFLICAEGLSALLRKAERDSLIKGISICRGGPRISHLFFADDSIIFYKATVSECGALQDILSLYERAFGQMINTGKTALFFSYNTPPDTRTAITNLFGTSVTTQFEKYLGLPHVIGRSKKCAFNDIKDRVHRRLQGWKEKLLSQAGREVLMKAVIQAIPTYAMSCFKFPVGFCDELSSMATEFWWGQKDGARKIHWLSKKKLLKSKKEGGMGFRDLQLFNDALLVR
jgi:hypothetical protein